MNTKQAVARTQIWHQSITDLVALPGYEQSIAAIAGQVARAGTEVSVHGVQPGTYPVGLAPIQALRSPWAHHLLVTQVVLGALEAERQGFDAVAISCFYDPGLREARSLVAIPVVSACETALTVALAQGDRCGLIALDLHQADFLRRLVRSYGLQDRVAAVVAVEPNVNELELDGQIRPDALITRMEAAAFRCLAAGANIIVPAEGVLNAMLASNGVRILAGAPVVDAVASLIAHAEMLVQLRRTTYSVKSTSDPIPLAQRLKFQRATSLALS